jgi:glutamine amidotransferase
MADKGFENIESKGLGWVPGSVENLYPDDKNLKIPHMGWNEVNFKRDDGKFSDLNGEDFYFVHSYYFNVKNTNNILATTNYNQPFPSALIKKNIIGTQFHPEKSQRSGVEFIKRFLMWKP